MEILCSLCQVDENDSTLSENLEPRVYRAIMTNLLVADIQLIIHALEVLYQLSELGENTTDQIAAVDSSIGKIFWARIVIFFQPTHYPIKPRLFYLSANRRSSRRLLHAFGNFMRVIVAYVHGLLDVVQVFRQSCRRQPIFILDPFVLDIMLPKLGRSVHAVSLSHM